MDYGEMLAELEMKGALVRGHGPAVQFMIEACRKVSLPDVLSDALDVAGRYLRNGATNDDLIAARIRCWQSIEARDSDMSDRRVAAARAVICTLYPGGSADDLFDTLGAFEDFALAAGLPPDGLVEGLRRAFG